MHLTSILIGQDNLLIQCAKLLLERNHQICRVVTPIQTIQAWCEENHLPWVSSLDDLPADREQSVDYLFSVVNGKILTRDELKIARVAAINYHDSLLPKYAGVNATTWSIMNGEQEHGITWHLINEGIDCGDIVYQGRFALNENETALTLNLRCFEEAVKGFCEILDSIELHELTTIKQPNEGRSYYGINHVLPNMGFIDWKTATAQSLMTTYRALNFGNYSNHVGTVKIILNQHTLTVINLKIANHARQDKPSGTILAIEDQGLLVNTHSEPVWLSLANPQTGKGLTKVELLSIYKLEIQQPLPEPSGSFIQNNTPLYKKALSSEKYWLSQLTQITEHGFYTDRLFDVTKKPKQLTPARIKQQVCNPKTYLLAAVLLYLYRINNYDNFTIYYGHLPSEDSAGLLADQLPLSVIDFQSDYTVKQLISTVNSKLVAMDTYGSYLNDIFIRQPALASVLSEMKASFMTLDFLGAQSKHPDNALIHFAIDEKQGQINISHRINLDFQGGSVAPVLENLSDHLTMILDTLLNQPDTRINAFSFLTQEEKAKLMDWSVGESLPLPSNTFTFLFEQRVQFSQSNPAIYDELGSLDYQQLWTNAEKVCSFLQSQQLKPQTVIGIALPPGRELLAIILGVLKAGCIAYPFNESGSCSPAEKLDLVISSSALDSNTKYYEPEEILALESTVKQTNEDKSIPKQDCLLLSDKRLMLNQKQLINYSYWLANNHNYNDQSISRISEGLSFNRVVMQALSVLLTGGAIDFRKPCSLDAA